MLPSLNYNDPAVKQAIQVLQSFLAVGKAAGQLSQKNADSLGLTLQQMAILNTLNASPGLTLKQVAERLGASKSTLSVNVDGLVKQQLVVRSIPEGNRREVNLSLSPEGQARSSQSLANAYAYRAMQAALEGLPEEDIQAVLRINKQLGERLEAAVQAYE